MKFIITFGAGTFHQPACKHVAIGGIAVRSERDGEALPTVEIAYEEVLGLVRHPWSFAKACSDCLPLMRLEANGFIKRKHLATAAEIAKAAGVQAEITQRSGGEARVLVSQAEEIKLELELTQLKQRLNTR